MAFLEALAAATGLLNFHLKMVEAGFPENWHWIALGIMAFIGLIAYFRKLLKSHDAKNDKDFEKVNAKIDKLDDDFVKRMDRFEDQSIERYRRTDDKLDDLKSTLINASLNNPKPKKRRSAKKTAKKK